MMHLNEGQLRAYYDGALAAAESARIQAHLATCVRCARTAETLQMRAARVADCITALASTSTRAALSPAAARQRFQTYLTAKKEQPMFNRIFSQRYRAAWMAAACVAALAVALMFPPVRTLADAFLGLFRVQEVTFVSFNPSDLPQGEAAEAAMERLELLLQEQAAIEGGGEAYPLELEAARAFDGFVTRFPAALSDTPTVLVEPGFQATVRIDLQTIREVLHEMGYKDIVLPDTLDGARVSFDFGAMVTASYGYCAPAGNSPQDCTTLAQMPAPAVEAPDGLDLEQLGQAYLQLFGMDAAEAAKFSARVDWATTLVVPIPASQNLKYQDVLVDGVEGTFITQPTYNGDSTYYLLAWVKDDIIYALNGVGRVNDAVAIANSLQ